ncbi:MAG: PilN domain-containing protein [Deltaproteobacteria bacterium]|nr:PilN domain-containing protein [Candidatus Anaeroferrophillacea bacterium]
MQRINLATTKKTAAAGLPGALGMVFAVLSLLLLAALAGHYYHLRRHHDAARETTRQLERTLADRERENEVLHRLVRETRKLEARQQALDERIAAVDGMFTGRQDWHAVVSEISRLVPAGVWLTEIASSAAGTGGAAAGGPEADRGGGPAVMVHGRAVDSAALVAFLKKLQAGEGRLAAVDFREMIRVPADAATGIPAHFAFALSCELAAGMPAPEGTHNAAAVVDHGAPPVPPE